MSQVVASGAPGVALSASACEQYPFLVWLADHEALSVSELHMLERFALGRRKADFVEKQVLQSIFQRVQQLESACQLNGDLGRFRQAYGI